MTVLQARRLTKVYGGSHGAVTTRALDGFDLHVDAGEFVGIMGPSGSGKSTLLQLLGTIDTATSGEILLEGNPLAGLTGNALALFRRRRLGFIFQEFNLLDSLTVRENIMIPLALGGLPARETAGRVEQIAQRLGIDPVLDHYPYECSGGEKQRAAAARALVHAPALVLADEPTGNLDSKAARGLMESLSALNERERATILMVTHDPVCASYCSRVLFIKDGQRFTELRRGADQPAFFQQILAVLTTLGGHANGGARL